MDRIDPLYYTHSSRINLKEETRIKATSEEAATWEQAHRDPNGLWKCFTSPTHNYIIRPFTPSQLPHRISPPIYSTSLSRWAITDTSRLFRVTLTFPNILMISSGIRKCSMAMDRGWALVEILTRKVKLPDWNFSRLPCRHESRQPSIKSRSGFSFLAISW